MFVYLALILAPHRLKSCFGSSDRHSILTLTYYDSIWPVLSQKITNNYHCGSEAIKAVASSLGKGLAKK